MSSTAALNCNAYTSASYVSIPGDKMATGLATGSVTLMAWVKTSGYTTAEVTVIGADLTTPLYLKILNGNYVFGTFSSTDLPTPNGAPPPTSVTVSTAIVPGDDGNWVHLCGSYTSPTWSIYRNGFLCATTNGNGYTLSNTSWYIGGRPGNSSMTCNVELRAAWIFGSAIAQTSLQTYYLPIYGALPSTPPNTDNLVAYWPLNDGGGQNINDLSQVNPVANGRWSSLTIQWGTDFTLGSIAFCNQGQDFADVYASVQTTACTFFIDAGTYPCSTTIMADQRLSSIVGSGPDATLITGSSTFLLCPRSNPPTLLNSFRQFNVQIYGAGDAVIGTISCSLTLEYVTIGCSPLPDQENSAPRTFGLASRNGHTVTLNNCTISAFPDSDTLESLAMSQGTPTTLNNCTLMLLSDRLGVVLYCYNSTVVLNNCTIQASSSTQQALSAPTLYHRGTIIANQCKINGTCNGNVIINDALSEAPYHGLGQDETNSSKQDTMRIIFKFDGA